MRKKGIYTYRKGENVRRERETREKEGRQQTGLRGCAKLAGGRGCFIKCVALEKSARQFSDATETADNARHRI